jgi:hypothetical protein
MVATLLKFVFVLGLPAIGLWFLFAVVATPLAAIVPVYVKMLLSPIWFVIGFFVALLGWNRKLGFWVYFLISLLLTPIVGFLVVIMSDKKTHDHEPGLE